MARTLTMVLPRSSKIPLTTTGGLETVAIRMPSHPVARAVIRAAGVPLAAPSANRSGSPSPTTFRHCVDDLWGLVDAIVESDDCTVGVESTVLCFLPDGTPQVLRPGAVTPEEIQRRCGCVSVAEAVLHMLPQDAAAPSPGMKYKHYAPAATLTLLCGSREDYAARVNEYYETLQRAGEEDGFYAMCFDEDVSLLEAPTISYGVAYDYPSQAQNLFDVLRQLDKLQATEVYVHAPEPEEMGLAVYNRLLRAAAFRVVPPLIICFAPLPSAGRPQGKPPAAVSAAEPPAPAAPERPAGARLGSHRLFPTQTRTEVIPCSVSA